MFWFRRRPIIMKEDFDQTMKILMALEVLSGKRARLIVLNFQKREGRVRIGSEEKDIIFNFSRDGSELDLKVGQRRTSGWLKSWYFASFLTPQLVRVTSEQSPGVAYVGRSAREREQLRDEKN